MTRDFGTLGTNITEARQSPVLMFPGITDYHQVQIEGTGTLASPTMAIYKEGTQTDLASTLLTGSMSVSGRVIKTKSIQNLVGGSSYRVYVFFTDGGIPTARQYQIIVPKFGVKPSTYQFVQDPYRLDESPIVVYPGQSPTWLLAIDGQGAIAGEAMTIYKGRENSSATNLSGSITTVGRSVTLKTISGLVGGSEYIFYFTFTDDGKNTIRYCELIVPKLGA